jgi:hypothetical protein
LEKFFLVVAFLETAFLGKKIPWSVVQPGNFLVRIVFSSRKSSAKLTLQSIVLEIEITF